MNQLCGFPYWQVDFDPDAEVISATNATLLSIELESAALTDLFVFSHGWNTTPAAATTMYEEYFCQMRALLDRADLALNKNMALGILGVTWPSILWPDDEEMSGTLTGGATSAWIGNSSSNAVHDDAANARSLKSGFQLDGQQEIIDELAALLEARPSDPEELARFWDLLSQLVESSGGIAALEEGDETLLAPEDPSTLADRLASEEPVSRSAATGANVMDRKWRGAKKALRLATFLCMKNRSGHIGAKGLAPLLRVAYERLGNSANEETPLPRLHLIGHSFGARLVSYAVHSFGSDGIPIGSVMLLQAAFSHYAFAPKLPHDTTRSGELAGMQKRVAGPVVVTHSKWDKALGARYSTAAMLVGHDAKRTFDPLKRWGSLGHYGAKGVDANDLDILSVGSRYEFTAATIVNMKCDAVIACGEGQAGAHSDIIHSELAWLNLVAASHTKEA